MNTISKLTPTEGRMTVIQQGGSMITPEEKEFVAKLNKEIVEIKSYPCIDPDVQVCEDARLVTLERLLSLIDRLSARCEELEREKKMAKEHGNNLQFVLDRKNESLSTLLSAVEPFEKLDKANWDKDMGMCPTWREDIKPIDLHNLSTVAAGIRGKG